MTVENLWKLPENTATERTPTAILSEQAPFLAKMTNELIRAHVSRRITAKDAVSVNLIVEAPALGSYRVFVLNVQHDLISPFPSRIRSHINEMSEEVESEDELLDVLRNILESEEMQKMLSSLLRESRMQFAEEDLPF